MGGKGRLKRPRRQSRMICTSNTYTHTHSARQRPLPSVNGHRSTFILSFLKFTDEEGRTAISWLSNDPPPSLLTQRKRQKRSRVQRVVPTHPEKKVYNGIVADVMFCFGWFSMNSMILLYPSAVHGLQVSNMNSLRRAQGRNQFVFCLF